MAPAPNGTGPHVNGFDEDDIDYSDIDAKCVSTHSSCHYEDNDQGSSRFRYQVQYDEGLDNVAVLDGIPVIDKSKAEKLLARIVKEFGKKGSQIKQDDMFVPWDEKTGKSKGCVSSSHSCYILCLNERYPRTDSSLWSSKPRTTPRTRSVS